MQIVIESDRTGTTVYDFLEDVVVNIVERKHEGFLYGWTVANSPPPSVEAILTIDYMSEDVSWKKKRVFLHAGETLTVHLEDNTPKEFSF